MILPQDELVACADRALYLAKTMGRSILGQGAKKDCRQCWRGGPIVLYAPFF
jgi:GGDEF domain-containing protein